MNRNYFYPVFIFFIFLLVVLIFKSWFSNGYLSSGDAPFYYPQNAIQISNFPMLWKNEGIGYYSLQTYPFFYMSYAVRILSILNIPFPLIERIIWFFPFIIISTFSSIYLYKILFPISKCFFLSPLIYLLNSYSLIIIGGGQISIALSYAIAPLIMGLFIKNAQKSSLRLIILNSIMLSLQLSFEPRICILTLGIVFLYYLFNFSLNLHKYILFIPIIIITFLLHFFWILPSIILLVLNHKTQFYLPEVVKNDWLAFLNFTRFSKAISFLHPNWPENIFGKSNFMQPEFLLLPILAFCSLLFVSKNKIYKQIIFFSFLALFGAFLAKGINPPFGEIYRFLYNNFPGFNMFRDSTKFYLFSAISYSILIPFSIDQIYLTLQKIIRKLKLTVKQFLVMKHIPDMFLLLITCCLLLLIKPAWSGELNGTFKSKKIPNEYQEVNNFIFKQKNFFRTLWIPAFVRYGYYDNDHPAINGYYLFNVSDPFKLVNILEKTKDIEKKLRLLSIKYIILPTDINGEYFSKDWKFNPEAKEKFDHKIDKIPYLKNKKQIGDIIIYEISNPKDHFWLENGKMLIYKMINPTKYEVSGFSNSKNNILVLSETYNSLWSLKTNGENISSERKYERLNSFRIYQKGKFKGIVEFTPQKYVYYGLAISILTLIIAIILLIIKK